MSNMKPGVSGDAAVVDFAREQRLKHDDDDKAAGLALLY